jgi:thymidine phosphorylase
MTSITPKRPRDADTKAMMTSYIDRLIQGENLSSSDVTAATEAIASGAVDPTQIAAFLVTLRMKVRNKNKTVWWWWWKQKKDSVLVVV